MKILFFIGEFSEGGAERVISILANSMVKKGIDIEILKYHNTINFYQTDKQIKISSVEEEVGNRKKNIKNLLWLRRYFKNNADIVISFLAPFNMFAIMANLGNGVPLIVADRNDPSKVPSNKYVRLLRDFLYTKADGVVLQTLQNQRYFKDSVIRKSTVIANPIDLKEKTGLALNSKKEDFIVSVGRLEKQKNQEMLIEAFSNISKKHPELNLIIYGEGSYRKNLEEKINSLGIEGKIKLPGNEKNILEAIAPAKAFVMSSNYEGMPNALMEAMCLGLPVISTKVSGTEELIKDGVNGLLVDVGDIKKLESSIEKVLENQDFSNNISKEAVKVASKLEIDNIVNKWMEFVNKTLKNYN